jgi:hypothetical protein
LAALRRVRHGFRIAGNLPLGILLYFGHRGRREEVKSGPARRVRRADSVKSGTKRRRRAGPGSQTVYGIVIAADIIAVDIDETRFPTKGVTRD